MKDNNNFTFLEKITVHQQWYEKALSDEAKLINFYA